MTRISVIIPMYNEARHIGRTLESVRRAARRAGCDWEIIVPDNGSTDAGPQIAREQGARVLDCPGISIGALRNRGAAQAQGEWLAFLDADMQVPEEWLETWRYVQNQNRAEVLGLVHLPPPQAPWYARAWLQRVGTAREQAGLRDWLPTANLCMPRTWFERVGGFDENLRTGEDKDLSLRLGQAGARLLSLPQPTVWNWGFEGSWSEWLGKELWRQCSHVQLLRKNGLSLRLLRFPLLASGIWLLDLLALLALVQQKWPAAFALFVLSLAPALGLALRETHRRFTPKLTAQLWFLHWLRLHVTGAGLLFGLFNFTPRRPARG
jgi:glycosyltransferase involved in cell wall biosynthesis